MFHQFKAAVSLSFVLGVLFVTLNVSWAQPASTQPTLNNLPAPAQVVKHGLDLLDSLPEPRKIAALQSKLAIFFDFGKIARRVAGPMARHLSTEQKQQLSQQIQQRFFTLLNQKLGNGRAFDYHFLPRHSHLNQHYARVVVGIRQQQQVVTNLTFHLIVTRTGWKVVDIVAQNNSIVLYMRQLFMNKIRILRIQGMQQLLNTEKK